MVNITPKRLDDVCLGRTISLGFRAYGPALQARNERGFGYDIFTKYNTTEPVLESMYAEELNEEKRAKIAELKKTDPKAAAELGRAISYHVDHGYGMDCYAVGPTLGRRYGCFDGWRYDYLSLLLSYSGNPR